MVILKINWENLWKSKQQEHILLELRQPKKEKEDDQGANTGRRSHAEQ